MPETIKLTHMYADYRTHRRQTTWGIGKIAPSLQEYLDGLPDKNLSILIPGAGNTYEAVYLIEQGFTNITMVDFSVGVMDRLRTMFDLFLDKQIRIITVDFFEHSGEYDLMIEQSFFTTIDPLMRSEYVSKTYSLLKNDGILAGALFERKVAGVYANACSRDEYYQLFSDIFKILRMEISKGTVESVTGSELFFEMRKK